MEMRGAAVLKNQKGNPSVLEAVDWSLSKSLKTENSEISKEAGEAVDFARG